MITLGLLIWLAFMNLSTLMMWGLGNLVIFVFDINYVWTIWHGLGCAILIQFIRNIFRD